MRPIVIRTPSNNDLADKVANVLIEELRGSLAPGLLGALDDVDLPAPIDARIRDWIAEIRSATPGAALRLDRLIALYRSLVVLYLGAFHYRPYWPADEHGGNAVPSLEMRERTPSVPIQQIQVAVAHLTLALHGDRARRPLQDAMLSEKTLLRNIAEKAAEKLRPGPKAA